MLLEKTTELEVIKKERLILWCICCSFLTLAFFYNFKIVNVFEPLCLFLSPVSWELCFAVGAEMFHISSV